MEIIIGFIKPQKGKFLFSIVFLIIGISSTVLILSYGQSVWNRHSFLFNLITRLFFWPLIPIFELKTKPSFYYSIFNLIGVPLFFIYYYFIGCIMFKFHRSIRRFISAQRGKNNPSSNETVE